MSKKATPDEKLQVAYETVFNSPSGELVLKHLAQSVGLFQPVFDPDDRVNAHNQGKQAVVLDILQRIKRREFEDIMALHRPIMIDLAGDL